MEEFQDSVGFGFLLELLLRFGGESSLSKKNDCVAFFAVATVGLARFRT